jgi:hypothetical protein
MVNPTWAWRDHIERQQRLDERRDRDQFKRDRRGAHAAGEALVDAARQRRAEPKHTGRPSENKDGGGPISRASAAQPGRPSKNGEGAPTVSRTSAEQRGNDDNIIINDRPAGTARAAQPGSSLRDQLIKAGFIVPATSTGEGEP